MGNSDDKPLVYALIAIVLLGTITILANTARTLFQTTSDKIQNANPGGFAAPANR